MEPEQSARVPRGFHRPSTIRVGVTATLIAATSPDFGDVVLKCWNRPLVTEDERENFRREVTLHRSISPDAAPHPGVVPFVAASDVDGENPWIATRPGGRALASLLEARAPAEHEAWRLVRDILDGVAALHEREIVHGDLTPGNILVLNGRASLCDLGLAGRVGIDARSVGIGTPEYMAPELIEHPGRSPDKRTDVYAAAIVIGEILDDLALPPQAEHIVFSKACSARPEDRPADAGEFARLLRAARLVGSDSTGLGFSRSARLDKRHLLIGLLSGLSLAILVVGAGWVLSENRSIAPAPGPATVGASPAMEAPLDGAQVISPIYPRGRGEVDVHESVWIVYRTGDRPYELFTEPAVLDIDRKLWSHSLDLGNGRCDEGLRFGVWAIALDDDAPVSDEARETFSNGLPLLTLSQMPPDGRVLGYAEVTMTKFEGENDVCPRRGGRTAPGILVPETDEAEIRGSHS